jgi:YggT family protein
MRTLIYIIDIFFQVYLIMLFCRILGSWIPELQRSRAMQFISFYTDPYLNIFRRIIPPLGMLDICPIFAFIVLELLNYIITAFLKSLIR